MLLAIGVDEEGYREVIGATEGMKEDAESWRNFLKWLKGRGLEGVRLIVGDKCLGMNNAVQEVYPEAKYQRCTVHFYRNVMSVTPRNRMREVTRMLKAIHAQESKESARKKAKDVVEALKGMRLKEAAKKVEESIEETLTYMEFPTQHWLKIRTNNVIERMNREMRRRTRVVGAFSGREIGVDAGMCETAIRIGKRLGNEKIFVHEIFVRNGASSVAFRAGGVKDKNEQLRCP